jgi:hypothetical protein
MLQRRTHKLPSQRIRVALQCYYLLPALYTIKLTLTRQAPHTASHHLPLGATTTIR